MDYRIEQHRNSVILTVTLRDEVTAHDMVRMFEDSAETLSTHDAPCWRIIMMEDAAVPFSEVMILLRGVLPQQKGSFSDPSIRTVFAGHHPMAQLIVDLVAKPRYGGTTVQTFGDLGQALLYIYDCIDEQTADTV